MASQRTVDPSNRAAITICVILATLMQALDTTIANVALPYMQGSLQASRDEITWVLTSYVIAAAIMTGPIGWMAARFGNYVVALGATGLGWIEWRDAMRPRWLAWLA